MISDLPWMKPDKRSQPETSMPIVNYEQNLKYVQGTTRLYNACATRVCGARPPYYRTANLNVLFNRAKKHYNQ